MAKAAQKKPAPKASTVEVIDVEQGSPEWFKARLGLPTASMFSVIMAEGRNDTESKTRTDYLYELAGETISGLQAERWSGKAMERGREMEDEARQRYERTHLSSEITRIGLLKNSGLMKYATVGASPDALVDDDGGLEIKTMIPKLLIRRLMNAATLPPEHKWQVLGNIWVSERSWWDISIYYPKMPPFVVRVERNDVLIKQLSDEVERFSYELKTLVAKLRAMGATG